MKPLPFAFDQMVLHTKNRTPRELGFRMPAEWEPHEATWIAWPHNIADWPGKFAAIGWVYSDIVRHLHQAEIVRILINDSKMEKRARRTLMRTGVDLSRIEFHQVQTNRVWVRDSGPIFVVRNSTSRKDTRLAITDWHFNAWAKYPNWQHDDLVPQKIASKFSLSAWQPTGGKPHRRIVLEGGSIDVNGEGILLTTEECLLSSVQQRNPGVSREEMERVFRDYLGIEKVIWLKNGIEGDDTHGHVDDLARFVDANTIAIVVEQYRSDLNYTRLQENLELVRSARNLRGKPFRVIELPMPKPVYFFGQRLPASYANFYIGNRVVLVPTFNDPSDRIALQTLSEVFKSRTVIGIHSTDLVWGLGTLHCMTQQQPAI
jgi:agmatine deiminase